MAKHLSDPASGKLVSYRYEVENAQGKREKGTIKAVSEVEAERRLIDAGYTPLSVEPVPSMFSLEEALPTLFKIKPRDVVIFSRQLATLLKSGISLLNTLEILYEQGAASRSFKKIMGAIADDLRGGGSFSQAITKHPKAFSEMYCKTIAVGEQSGNLEDVLHQMADFVEREGAIAKKVSKALAYPVMMVVMGLGTVILLVTTVMPAMIDMFTSMDADLPLPTRVLINVSDFTQSYQLHLLISVSLLTAVVLGMAKQPAGRRLLDRWKLKAPIIGTPNLMGELARFSRTMSMLITAGLSLQEIIEMAPQSTTNRAMRSAFEHVKERLFLGEGLASPMQGNDLFPPLLVQMVVVGEESNTLSYTMGVVADFYERSAEEQMTALVGMIGPVSTIGIALLVGFIALAVIMPMYSITGAL